MVSWGGLRKTQKMLNGHSAGNADNIIVISAVRYIRVDTYQSLLRHGVLYAIFSRL